MKTQARNILVKLSHTLIECPAPAHDLYLSLSEQAAVDRVRHAEEMWRIHHALQFHQWLGSHPAAAVHDMTTTTNKDKHMSTITTRDGMQIYYKDLAKGAAEWSLRVTIAAGFLSAVADRFGLWGPPGTANVDWGAWQPFVDYTRVLTFYLPQNLVPFTAIFATLVEAVLGVWLLVGWQTRVAAYASAALLLTFALSMTLALGVKSPLNYAVFTGVAAAFALAVLNTSPPRPVSPKQTRQD